MMDEFKYEQHKFHGGWWYRWAGKYGCPCCRMFNMSNRSFKKLTRKLAKARVRDKTAKYIRNWESEY